MKDPDYPNIILSFNYRGFKIEIDRDEWQGQNIYAAWVNYDLGCAVAVPCALTSVEAVRNAKEWIDRRLKKSN
jgi:hypothetical protein